MPLEKYFTSRLANFSRPAKAKTSSTEALASLSVIPRIDARIITLSTALSSGFQPTPSSRIGTTGARTTTDPESAS